MKLRYLAVVWLAATSLAQASTPGPDRLERVQQLFGIDTAIDLAIDRSFREDVGAKWSDAQRSCVAREVRPLFVETLGGAFGAMFETDANVDAWIAFGQTPAGAKVLRFVRDGVGSTVKGGPEPNPAALLAQLDRDELGAVAAFMSTPAGGILQKQFPDPQVPEARLKALQPVVERACSVRFD
ncbi:hypothetical protein [Lysobacter humi (ex Lee et al. 2017)]